MRHLLAAAAISVFSALQAAPARASNADCFCIKVNQGNTLQPYQVVKRASPACAGQTYKSNGKAPWDNGVPVCKAQGSPSGVSPAAAAQLIRRCFCAKHNGGNGIQQYSVISYPTVPECRQAQYRNNGRPAWERVLGCDMANQCQKLAKQCQAKMENASRTISSNSNELVALTKKCKASDDLCYKDPIK